MIECPQCGTTNEEAAKNCSVCRINLYWAVQHYQELAAIRTASQLDPAPETPAFLVASSQRADKGSTAGWLSSTIKKFGLKGAGKKVSTV